MKQVGSIHFLVAAVRTAINDSLRFTSLFTSTSNTSDNTDGNIYNGRSLHRTRLRSSMFDTGKSANLYNFTLRIQLLN